jgi:hypothetical protein
MATWLAETCRIHCVYKLILVYLCAIVSANYFSNMINIFKTELCRTVKFPHNCAFRLTTPHVPPMVCVPPIEKHCLQAPQNGSIAKLILKIGTTWGGVSGQLHAPVALSPGKTSRYPLRRWVGPRACMDAGRWEQYLSPAGNWIELPLQRPATMRTDPSRLLGLRHITQSLTRRRFSPSVINVGSVTL